MTATAITYFAIGATVLWGVIAFLAATISGI